MSDELTPRKHAYQMVLAVALFAISIVLGALAYSEAKRMTAKPVVGASDAAIDASAPVLKFVKNPSAAPDFQLTGIDGKPVSLAAARGKVTVLNFWATWCGPCKMEIPDLVTLQSRYPDKVQVIGIGNDDVSLDEVKKFAAKMRINYPVAITTPEVEKQFGGIAALPTSFVIDPQGRIVQKHVGVRELEGFDLEVRALAGLPVNAKIETFEDTGQIFIANAANATEIPGVDMSQLAPAQKKIALRRMNEESCTCGCKLTVAECRINDDTCNTSKGMAAQIVAEVAAGKASPSDPAAAHPATSPAGSTN